MSLQGLHDLDIHEYTGISEQSLKRFCSTYLLRPGTVLFIFLYFTPC